MTSRKPRRSQDERQLVRGPDAPQTPSATLRMALDQVPSLPPDAVQRALELAVRLPARLRADVLKIIANKLASDFALRYVLIVDAALNAPDAELHLRPTEARDEELLHSLLEPWTHAPTNIRVRGFEEFERFASITSGLQMMIEASLPQGQESWLFDSGPQYYSMLVRTHLLPERVLIASVGTGADGVQRVNLQATWYGAEMSGTQVNSWQAARPGDRDHAPRAVQPRLVLDAETSRQQHADVAVA